MSGSRVNLISQGSLQREKLPLTIISKGIEIDNEKILARFINNNFYIRKLADFVFFSTTLITINKNMLQFCHSRLGYLSKPNVFWLVKIAKSIDLSKSSPSDTCGPYTKTEIKVESHKAAIQLGKALLDLVYSNVYRLFPEGYDSAKYFIGFLDDWNKLFNIILLSRKSDILVAFQLFQ